jgi:hypothetical protein
MRLKRQELRSFQNINSMLVSINQAMSTNSKQKSRNIFIQANLKKSIEDALKKPHGEIAFRDLSNFIYLINSDDELKVMLDGLKRFQSQQIGVDLGLSKPLMQLLYILDKTEIALELFMEKVIYKIIR